jgi:hypothetical protein
MATKLGVFFNSLLKVLHTRFSNTELFKVITEHDNVHTTNCLGTKRGTLYPLVTIVRLLSGVPRNEVAAFYTVVTIVRVSE